ncbi:MAG: GTP-binding protein [Planctomycetota bacterium]|nr:GTP-binding protein [Planctomycetota bacterium]
MIRKKICLLGAFAVGKSSLVRRFVHSEYDDRYMTTVGVKVEKKECQVGDHQVSLVIWDLHGEDRWQEVRASYLRGTAGALLVADGTRIESLEVMAQLRKRLLEQNPDAHVVTLVNKMDREADFAITADEWRARVDWGPVVFTSARTGHGVEDAFQSLANHW